MMRGYGLGYWDEYDVATRRTALECLACALWAVGILDASRLEETGEVEMARHICVAPPTQQVVRYRQITQETEFRMGAKASHDLRYQFEINGYFVHVN
jgi:hypothetical protein